MKNHLSSFVCLELLITQHTLFYFRVCFFINDVKIMSECRNENFNLLELSILFYS